MAEEKGPSEAELAKIERQDPSGVNEAREVRADIIEAANEADAETAKAEQKAADAASKPVRSARKGSTTRTSDGRKAKRTADVRTAPQHVVKRDDAGAAEQQRSARDNAAATLTAEFDGPPVVAPIIEENLTKPNLRIVDADGSGRELKDEIFVTMNGRIFGTGFPAPGEVIIDIRREDGQDHQRFSTYTFDGMIDVALLGVNGPGEWLLHAESPVTRVGEGRDDHLPVIRQSKDIKLTVR